MLPRLSAQPLSAECSQRVFRLFVACFRDPPTVEIPAIL